MQKQNAANAKVVRAPETRIAATACSGYGGGDAARPDGPAELDGEQPLEQGAIAPQPLAEVLGRDLARLPERLELLTLGGEHPGQPVHHVHDEGVGVLDRSSRLVHEPGLDLLPAGDEALLVAGGSQPGRL